MSEGVFHVCTRLGEGTWITETLKCDEIFIVATIEIKRKTVVAGGLEAWAGIESLAVRDECGRTDDILASYRI